MLKTKPARIALLLCLLCIVALLTVTVVKAVEANGYHKVLIHEAGDPLPPAVRFLKNSDADAIYLTDPATIDVNRIGLQNLEIRYRNRTLQVTLDIRDTTPPAAVPVELDLKPGETAKPSDFVTDVRDASAVEIRFEQEPDFKKIGTQPVAVVLTDIAGNSRTLSTTLRLSALKAAVEIEADSTGTLPDPQLLLKDAFAGCVVDWVGSGPNLTQLGGQVVEATVDGRIYRSEVIVVDTVAPTGSAVDVAAWVGDELTADLFVTDIQDATPVTVTFAKEPDGTREGSQPVHLLLTDAAGNQASLTSSLTLTKDNEAPIIYGAKKYTLYIGQTATYKKDVLAIDNRDGEVEIKVDSSGVNPRVEGTYQAVYSATDRAGNSSSVDVEVVVKQRTVTMEELHELADQVLSEITTPDKSLYLKAWDIYTYVNLRLTYTGTSDKTDWMREARRGIVDGVGDCFTYYAMSNLLLDRIGMQTLSVERASKPGEARHFWHLVNWGEGWYHFDACIHIPKLESFMLTTAQMDAFSARVGKDNYYYRFDRDNYPASETKIVNDISVVGPY
ncbi:MAG: Ig-like domain repeat protein [Saccharofermentanales bacterium]|jgi:hypothetical protein|nr:DUF5011 domain-containing protein [Clostridiaceae bacterium]